MYNQHLRQKSSKQRASSPPFQMVLSKLQRIFITVGISFILCLTLLFEKSITISTLFTKGLHLIVSFVMIYWLLGIFYGQKSLHPIRYPSWLSIIIKIYGWSLLCFFGISLLILLLTTSGTAFMFMLLYFFMCSFVLTMIHLFYTRKMPIMSSLIFSGAYLFSFLTQFILESGQVKLLFLILFAITSLVISIYSNYVLLKYIIPQLMKEKYTQKRIK